MKHMTSEDLSQTLQTIFVLDETVPKPKTNLKYVRLYDHYLCPFAEKVRMTLAMRAVKYQSCQMNLEKKTQWHIDINQGMTPVIEFPDGTIKSDSIPIMQIIEKNYNSSGYSSLPMDKIQVVMSIVPQLEALGGTWFPIFMKRSYDEADFAKLKAIF